MTVSGRVVATTIALAALTVLPTLASADLPPVVQCGGPGQAACGICDIAKTAQNILNTGIYIAVFLSAVFFAYAGWQYLTTGGDTGKASSARSIFTNVAVGLCLLLAAWLIIDTIMKAMFNSTAGFGPWNQIC